MDRVIYTALAGMEASMNRQRAVSSNLANAQTPGFRAESFSVQAVALRGASLEARAMGRGAVYGADLSHGSMSITGNRLDVAVQGDAMIALQGRDGGEVYTRRGDLRIAAGGVLENGEGRPVMGTTGPITVPIGQEISIAEDGSVMAADPQAPDAPAQVIGRIKLASIQGSSIVKDLDGFLTVRGGGILPADEEARINTGSLEQSNVSTTQVLSDMIEAQRSFEMRAKLLTTATSIDETGARLMSIR